MFPSVQLRNGRMIRRGQRMTHRGAFVDDLDPVRLQDRDGLRWIAAGGFDDPNPALDDRVDVFRVWRRRE
jgi:hypothetical protein